MVQLKKKAVLLIGAAMLFLGMGMNLQYALDDYGLAKNNAVIAIWAQQIQTGKDPAGTGGNDGGCKDCNLAGEKVQLLVRVNLVRYLHWVLRPLVEGVLFQQEVVIILVVE